MGTIIMVAIGIIVAFAIFGFLFSKPGDKEDGAKVGAMVGATMIGNLLPVIIVIVFVVLIVRACS